jgi:hypothetical protein
MSGTFRAEQIPSDWQRLRFQYVGNIPEFLDVVA